jgi:SAM-dependent methyltransferase
VLDVVGPEWVVDEMARDEDPEYIEAYVGLDLPAYVPREQLATARILDFGCGGGASTCVLHRLFPEAELVGVELDPGYLTIGEARRDFYGAQDKITFLQAPSGDRLPEGVGEVDFIVLSAVFEHVLPDERDPVLDMLFKVLRPGGVLVLDQTPHRWFPQESHTTLLPFLNYLPRSLAQRAAPLSPRVEKGADWDQLLRWGLRGGTGREILRRLERLGHRAERLKPSGDGIRDEVDLWYRGPSFTGYGPIKPAWNVVARGLYRATGHALVPYISVGIRKLG